MGSGQAPIRTQGLGQAGWGWSPETGYIYNIYPMGSGTAPIRTRGLGQTETPDVKSLPWQIDQEPTEEELKAEKRAATFDKVSMVVGLLGGIFGLILSVRALRSGE
jgi:hypothetical protein